MTNAWEIHKPSNLSSVSMCISDLEDGALCDELNKYNTQKSYIKSFISERHKPKTWALVSVKEKQP